jgi:hypothetical protein
MSDMYEAAMELVEPLKYIESALTRLAIAAEHIEKRAIIRCRAEAAVTVFGMLIDRALADEQPLALMPDNQLRGMAELAWRLTDLLIQAEPKYVSPAPPTHDPDDQDEGIDLDEAARAVPPDLTGQVYYPQEVDHDPPA